MTENSSVRAGRGAGAHEFGDAEVGDFDASLAIEQDVFRFDVAVNDALLVGELEGFADAGDDRQCFLGLETAFAEELAEAGAIDVFHHQVEEAAGFAGVMDGDDIGMVEAGQCLGFAKEAFAELRVARGVGGKDFEGDDGG
jgi:hypothetical protein